ncbi:MAG: hypothetical protein KBS81_00875, partial [Spirochaetales bacterium]|nr:hypothetical protein [Candidatus Physcosoma equi]
YQMEFYGTPHNAIDDAINAARLLLHLDVELKNHLPKEFLNSSFLQNEVWKPPINYEKNPTFKSYARSVLEKKFAKGYISPDKRIVMERFVLTAPFSDHFLRYLKKRDVDEYLWKMKTYPPAEAFYRDIYKMVRDVVEKAEIEGLVSFPDEKNQEEKRKERRRKKQAMQRRKLWDYSERLFNRNWYIPKDKFICEIAFFTGMPFDSIVTLRGSDVECELKPVFGYPWTEGIRVQSESLGEFLSSIGSDEWLFSPDGLSFPDQSDVETVFRQECIRLGIDKGQDFSKLQDCYQKLKAKEFLEHFDSFDISSEQDDPEALPTCL